MGMILGLKLSRSARTTLHGMVRTLGRTSGRISDFRTKDTDLVVFAYGRHRGNMIAPLPIGYG